MKHNKILVLSVIAAVLFLIITGCSSPATTTPATITTTTTVKPVSPFTGQQLQQIIADATTAMKSVTVYKMTMDITTSVVTDGSAPSLQIIKGNVADDQAQNQMIMDAALTMDDGSGSQQTQAVTLYVLKDFVYLKVDVPNAGEKWVKTQATEAILKSFGANIAQEQMTALVSPAAIEWVGYAAVNGTDCYVLKITPNDAYLRQYAGDQTNNTIDWNKVGDMKNLFKEIYYQVSIAKDTKYVQAITIKGTVELTGDMMTTGGDFKKKVSDVTGIIGLSDFNVPLVITLPAGAASAVEISPEALLGQ